MNLMNYRKGSVMGNVVKAQWVKWKNHAGPRVRGSKKYAPEQPLGPWTKIMGVVARCEGNHDTVVMYDATGVTWGFMQWTFTSGRLQKLLQSLKSIPVYDFTGESDDKTLFDSVCCDASGKQIFSCFGFEIRGGKFFDLALGRPLNPAKGADKKRIVSVCMGTIHNDTAARMKHHAMTLARLFSVLGQSEEVAAAQVQFAKQEFKRQLRFKRKPLGRVKTMEALLDGTWDTPLPALFLNLWQNNPGAAYRLILRARGMKYSTPDELFNIVWRLTCRSKFGNWGYGKAANKTPRVTRIRKAIIEFYGITLPLLK